MTVIGVALALAARADEPQLVKVKGDRVNLRGRAEVNGEVVGQVMAGDELKVVQNGEHWIGVAPPGSVRCWIHKDFVRDGVVATKELSVRAGPSINYPRVGSLFRGDAVTPRETFGEWFCVPPPSNAVVWIHRELLDLPAAAQAAVEATATPLPAQPVIAGEPPPMTVATNLTVIKIAPSRPDAEEAPKAADMPEQPVVVMPPGSVASNAAAAPARPPADLNLVPLPGQGQMARHEGYVKPSPYLFAPGKYRLALKKGNTLETICFLRGNSRQLAGLVDQYFAMQGPEYWVQGVREPLLVIERIERRPDPANP